MGTINSAVTGKQVFATETSGDNTIVRNAVTGAQEFVIEGDGGGGGTVSQIQSDWNQTDTTKKDYIKNKPSLATVATSGSYTDLAGLPSLATVATSGSYTDLAGLPTIPEVRSYELSAGTWTSSAAISGYGYACALAVTGVTADSEADVIFGAAEAVSGNYAPVCTTGTGTVTIYGKVNTAITVKVRVY